jgi:hypothetical protein
MMSAGFVRWLRLARAIRFLLSEGNVLGTWHFCSPFWRWLDDATKIQFPAQFD